jgi:hypothetical protein
MDGGVPGHHPLCESIIPGLDPDVKDFVIFFGGRPEFFLPIRSNEDIISHSRAKGNGRGFTNHYKGLGPA